MNIKKKNYYLSLIILVITLILLTGCIPMNMNSVVKEPNFSGIIEEVYEKSILVKVNENESMSSDLVRVSLDLRLKDSITDFEVGEEVRIYYDGNIAESYPAQVNNVYTIRPIESDNQTTDVNLEPTKIETVNDFDDVTMVVRKETVSPKGLTLVFENKSNNHAIYGEYFLLEQKINDKWYEVPISINGDYGFNDIGYELNTGQSREYEMDWEWLYGSLETGDYRIIKDVSDFKETGDYHQHYLSAEFEIN